MTRLKEFKENNPEYSWSIIDVLSSIDISKTNKFVPLFLRVIKSENMKGWHQADIDEVVERISRTKIGYTKEQLKGISFQEFFPIYLQLRTIESMINDENREMLYEFMDCYEKGYIKNVDLNKINTLEEVMNLVSLSSISKIKNELSKQVITVFEDNRWLLVRPLTWESSKKYGSATRWCTTNSNNPDHFYRYAKRGVLLYCINLETGYKVALFKDTNVDVGSTGEMSFWNAKDDRIDSMQTELEPYIFDVIRNLEQVSNEKLSNGVMEKEEKSLGIYELKSIRAIRLEEDIPEEPHEYPTLMEEEPETEMFNEIREELNHEIAHEIRHMVYRDHMDNRPYREVVAEMNARIVRG